MPPLAGARSRGAVHLLQGVRERGGGRRAEAAVTRDEMAHEMREAVLALLDEICEADGHDTKARDAGRRALDKSMRALLSKHNNEVDWTALEGMSAEQIRAITREVLRPVVLRELAPLRPS